jgi:ABC-2 type transport system ATP-binding protein
VLHVGVADRFGEAAEIMARFPGVSKVSRVEGALTVNGKPAPLFHVAFEDGKGHAFTDLPNVLINQGFRIAQFSEEPVNLETAFMRLTKGLVQ